MCSVVCGVLCVLCAVAAVAAECSCVCVVCGHLWQQNEHHRKIEYEVLYPQMDGSSRRTSKLFVEALAQYTTSCTWGDRGFERERVCV